MEAFIKTGIAKPIKERTLLKISHHGFCKGELCLTNLLLFFEKMNKHVDMGDLVNITYLESITYFQKASDKDS